MNAAAQIDAIGVTMPWEDDDKQDMRRRLHLCRDLAAKRATHTPSETARSLFWTASYAAGENLFAPAPLEHLKDVRDTCLRLWAVAGAFERWEAGQ